MDKNGLHIKGGGLDISNNAGTKVLSADTSGNLSITGAINATSGKIGIWEIGNTALRNSFQSGVADGGRVGLSPGVSDDLSTLSLSSGLCFWAGATWDSSINRVNYANAPFRVRANGSLYARNATITGGSISVSTDIYVGNNIYIGNQSTGSSYKFLMFDKNHYLTLSNGSVSLYSGSNSISIYDDILNSPLITMSSTGNVSIYAGLGVNTASVRLYGSDQSAIMDGKKVSLISSGDVIISTGGVIRLKNKLNYEIKYWHDASYQYGGFFTPQHANNVDKITLGTKSYPWHRLYAQYQPVATSDIRKKTNIREYDIRYEKMYMDLKPIIYEFKNDIGNAHCGLIAQWVEEAMDKHGITDKEFGVLDYDAKEDAYGLSYSELTSLNMHMIQKTIKRVDTHDKEIAELKSEIARLQSKLDAYVNGTIEIKRA